MARARTSGSNRDSPGGRRALGLWRRWGGAGMLLAAAAVCKKALLARVRDREEVLQR